MLNLHHYQKLSRSLNPSLKMRVRFVAPFYIERIRHLHDPRSLYAAAVTALKPYFSQATPDQLDVVVAYLLGFVASGEGDAAVNIDIVELMKPAVAANTRLGAARTVIENSMKLREFTELEERLAALEKLQVEAEKE